MQGIDFYFYFFLFIFFRIAGCFVLAELVPEKSCPLLSCSICHMYILVRRIYKNTSPDFC